MLVGDLSVGQGTDLSFQRSAPGLGQGEDRLDLVGKFGDRACGPLLTIGPGDLVQLAQDFDRGLFPGRTSCLVFGPLLRSRQSQVIARQERREERLQPVIVLLEDRIELVIVATGAAHAQAQEDLTRDVGDVVEDVGPLSAGVALVVLVGPQSKVAGRDAKFGVIGIEFVAGELLGQESIIRFVGIQALDDVVAISPRSGSIRILAITVRLGVADQVEPVACPSLAVAGGCEQAIDQSLIGIRFVVGQECVDRLGRGRQAGDVEGHATDQRRLIGLRCGRQAVVEQSLQDESVDRGLGPSGPDRRLHRS